MSWRLIFTLGLLAALGTAGWWLDGHLENQAWAVAENGKWQLAGTGWETLKHAWPAALAGLLVSGVVLFFVFGYSYAFAEDADHEKEIARYRAETEQERQRANSAEARAKAQYQEKMAAVEQVKQDALKTQYEAEDLKARAVEAVKQAQKQVEKAEKQAAFEKTKKQRAEGAMFRAKRKNSRTS